MFPFNLFRPLSRRSCKTGVFALPLLLIAILFMACPMQPDDYDSWTADQEWIQEWLAGDWESQHGEVLEISIERFKDNSPWGGPAGIILAVEIFSPAGTSGVIFIQLDAGQTNFDGSPFEGVTGFHFDNLTATQMNGGWAFGSGPGGETFPTLQAAQAALTMDTVSTYFSNMTSLYTRQ